MREILRPRLASWTSELKRKALEMRRDGLGYKSIAGALGVGVKRVRNAVDDIEKGIEGHTQPVSEMYLRQVVVQIVEPGAAFVLSS